MSPLNITQPLGIWFFLWLLFQVMSNIPKMGQLPTPLVIDGLPSYKMVIFHGLPIKNGKTQHLVILATNQPVV